MEHNDADRRVRVVKEIEWIGKKIAPGRLLRVTRAGEKQILSEYPYNVEVICVKTGDILIKQKKKVKRGKGSANSTADNS